MTHINSGKFSSSYKWYVLALTMLTTGVIAGAERMTIPVLFKEISGDLGLNIVAVGTIWGMDPLAGIFISLPGGLLVDRFGVKRTLTVVSILAGIFSALRGFSVSFPTLAAFVFLFGLMAAMTPAITPKTTAVWFSRNYLGLTNALLNIALSVGAMAATITSSTILSPMLGGWRNVMFLLGIPAVVVGLLWLFTGREPRKSEVIDVNVAQSVPFRQAIRKVIRIKQIWMYGVISLALWGANMGLSGYLTLYLQNIGWTPAGASAGITILTGASTLGIIPMVLLANRMRMPKGIFLFSIIVLAVSLVLLPLVEGPGVLAVLIISGFLRSAIPALTNMMIFETKGVGSTYGGSAIGLVSSIGMVGAFVAPPLGNKMADYGAGGPFFFWAGLAALAIPAFLILRKMDRPRVEAKEIELNA